MKTVLLAALTAVALSACAGTGLQPPRLVSLPDLTSYALVRTDRGMPTPVNIDQAADVLKDYDVIFLGEIHRHPANHAAQMALYRAIQVRVGHVDLSLEQFERDVQPVVDDYMAGRIGEETLRDKGRAWDNYPTSYRPLVEYARERHFTVIAAEAPGMVVRCVGQEGPGFLDRMKPEQRAWAAAELHLGDDAYKDKFLRFAAGSGNHGKDTKDASSGVSAATLRSFAAQVTRDDTMAESLYRHLQHNPGHKIVHLNGAFHSESFLGTAERLTLRDPRLKIAVVNPIMVENAQSPVLKAEDATTGTFVLLLPPLPEAYASDEEAKAAITKQMSFRKDNKCEL